MTGEATTTAAVTCSDEVVFVSSSDGDLRIAVAHCGSPKTQTLHPIAEYAPRLPAFRSISTEELSFRMTEHAKE